MRPIKDLPISSEMSTSSSEHSDDFNRDSIGLWDISTKKNVKHFRCTLKFKGVLATFCFYNIKQGALQSFLFFGVFGMYLVTIVL